MAAIRGWQMFNIPWVHSVLAQCSRYRLEPRSRFWWIISGFHSLNACRIVYAVDEDGPIKRFGFAYGTLWEHAESGEERFTVEWRRNEDEVWYDILAFSRPGKWRPNWRIRFRGASRKFAEASKLAMLRAANTD